MKSAFAKHGLPLVETGTTRVVGLPVVEFEFDPAKLVTKQAGSEVLHAQFLVILLFKRESDATRALRDPRERRAIRTFGLTVVARENVVATLLRGQATRDRIARVNAAVKAATNG